MKTPYQFKHIRTRFSFWFVSVAIVPLIVATFIIYNQRVEVIKYNQFQKLTSIRDLKVQNLSNWIKERTGDIQSFSQDHELRTYAETAFRGIDISRNGDIEENALIVLNQKVELYSSYQEIFILDPITAKVLLSTNKSNLGVDKSSYHFYQGTLETNSVSFTDIVISKDLGNKPGMTYSITLRCLQHEGEHTTGVLVARIDLENSLYTMLMNRVGMGETGETLIINKDLMALNELRHYPNAPLNLKIGAAPAVNAVEGKTGIIEDADYRGEPVLAAYTYIAETGWGFVAKQDQKEVYSSINTMVKDISLLVLISILFIYVVSILLSRFTTKPVLDMVAVSRKIAGGDYSVRNLISTIDEMSILARTNNDFAESIESQLFIRDGLGNISDVVIAQENIKELCNGLVQIITQLSGSQMGAFYLSNNEIFKPLASVGYDVNKLVDFSALKYDGEFGQALATKEITLITDIPEDSIFVFKAVAGTAMPREIINVPILVKEKVVAILSLSTLTSYSKDVFELIKQSHKNLNVGFSNMLAEEEARKTADEIQVKNIELESLAAEFKAQADEVSEQNVELDAQRRQVEGANRLKSEFLSNMSHELRTPLNSIISLSKVLLDQTSGTISKKQAGYLEIVTRNGSILLELINDILDLSKIESGQLEISVSSVSPADLVDGLVESIKPLASEKGINLKTNIESDLPNLTTDEFLVHRILQNIVSNAVKFTEEGEVLVSMKANNDKVFISIKDTGIGISKEMLIHIFEEFRQADGTTSRKYEGTGLGLAIAKRSANLLNGDITVESKLNKGSTFTVELPIEWTGEMPDSDLTFTHYTESIGTAVNAVDQIKSPKEIKLLIVEDQEPIVIQLTSILKRTGYHVSVASGGQEAIEYCKETVPDGIILDLMMPEVDGFQVLETIRSRQETAHIPVLILTAKDLTKADLSHLSANNIQQLVQKGDIAEDLFLNKISLMLGIEKEAIEHPKPVEKQVQTLRKHNLKAKSNSILVIEDNPDNMTAIKAIIDSKYTIFEATDGEMGLNLIKSKHPNLVLCDIMLPKLDGIAVIRKVRADENLKGTPCIAITAKAMKGDKERILSAGFDAYVTKPINQALLTKLIKRSLK